MTAAPQYWWESATAGPSPSAPAAGAFALPSNPTSAYFVGTGGDHGGATPGGNPEAGFKDPTGGPLHDAFVDIGPVGRTALDIAGFAPGVVGTAASLAGLGINANNA